MANTSHKEVNEKLQDEVTRCAKDFYYFCPTYLRIVDKRGRLVPLELNAVQRRFLSELEENPWVYVLKARQLGLTTILAAYNFWKAAFTPNHHVAVIAHRTDSAQTIFEIYKRFYDHLPDFLTFPTDKANVRELRFFHGGLIRVMTAQSEGIRGTTYHSLHCSEFAFWGDVEKSTRAAFQTAGPNACIALETTANGLNHAHQLWHSDDHGFHKVFFPWTEEELYRRKEKNKTTHPKLNLVAREYELDQKQINWAQHILATKCMGNWNSFLQEYPLSAEQAFITSGERFFDCAFPHAQSAEGHRLYQTPEKYRVYSIGVDVASGTPSGDYSAFCVMDVTDKKEPKVMSTYYGHVAPHAFGKLVIEEAKKYNALVVVESNSYGLAVLEYLIQNEYAFIFRRNQYDKIGNRWIEKMGFHTSTSTRPVMLSRLLEHVSKKWLIINDERMKCEINSFVYDEKGKPIAAHGKHDDMIFAHGLALMGLDQIEYVKEEVQSERPQNLREMLLWERNTGQVYKNETGDSHFEMYGVASSQSSPLDAVLNNSSKRR
jgi:hypothetical protein